ncbi:helix-turn-helix domain-containing protein [Luteimonas vadosa]|uniref:TetR/AcrR family transcriptional regulator n=1 Tax=Luteimonas vadosa TaxID=1165507 RepID=A0ABP9DSV7_9GAMM
MSACPHRQRELADRENVFLDTAQALIQRDGLLNLQMSRIAERSRYAIGTLYQHFASKEDLLVALATRNCLSRVDLFRRAALWPGPTRERMLAVALADLMVMRDKPEYFRLTQFVWSDVVWNAASPDSRRRSLAASAPLAELVDGIVAAARSNGDLPASVALEPQALTIGPWSLCLGLHTLAHVDGMLDAHAAGDPHRLLIKHLHYLLNGYGWQPLFDPADDTAVDAQVERICKAVFGTACPAPSPQLLTSPETSHA